MEAASDHTEVPGITPACDRNHEEFKCAYGPDCSDSDFCTKTLKSFRNHCSNHHRAVRKSDKGYSDFWV